MIAYAGLILIFAAGGCHYFYDQVGETKRIPYPVPKSFPTEIEGELYRVWYGNELQIKLGYQTAYIVLQGVNNPDRDADVEARAVKHLESLFVAPKIRVVVNQTDARKRMIGQVYCGENHVNLAMIESGWGQYDGTDFADAGKYEAAQALAQSKKLGMWADADSEH